MTYEPVLTLIGVIISSGAISSIATLYFTKKRVDAQTERDLAEVIKAKALTHKIETDNNISIGDAWRVMAEQIGKEWNKTKLELAQANLRIDALESKVEQEEEKCQRKMASLHLRIIELEQKK